MSKFVIDLVNPENGQHCCIYVDIDEGDFVPAFIRRLRPGHANFEVEVVNPRTNEQRKILVELSPRQAEVAITAPWLPEYVQALAKPRIPEGFLLLGNGVRPVTLQ
jgi:hypothetical protein